MRNQGFLQFSSLAPVDEKEVFRYAGGRGEADGEVLTLLRECIAETQSAFAYKACFAELTVDEFFARFGKCKLTEARLQGCERAVIFAATLGIETDRRIARYASVYTAKALLLQALGAERIEALCDKVCETLAAEYETKGYSLGTRFSAGYGDFPLSAQTEFFQLLDCNRALGLTLNESLLMSPSKSVTAAIGISKKVISNK